MSFIFFLGRKESHADVYIPTALLMSMLFFHVGYLFLTTEIY